MQRERPSPVNERRTQFASLLTELEGRAHRSGVPFVRQRMAGTKRDLIELLRRAIPSYSHLSESAIEEDMRAVGCKFPSPGTRPTLNIRRLFPEFF